MRRVLVTGANGHIGAHTVRSLLSHNYQVVPMVRRGANTKGIDKLGLENVYGDILDYDAVLSATQGCDVIIHHASVYKMWVEDPDEIIKPAMIGTENIFKAAKSAGVGRMIYTSSMAAVGFAHQPDQLRTDADWNSKPYSVYYSTKAASERLAINLSHEYQIPTIRLCPTLVLGPLDYRVTPSTRSILNLLNGVQSTYEGGLNYVHVADVATAHVNAIEMGKPGSRYIVGGENLHQKQVADLLYKITGHKPIHLGITGPLAELTGSIFGWISRITRKPPIYDRATVQDMVGKYGYFDCGLTNDILGLTPISAEQIFMDTIRWLSFLGLIKPRIEVDLTISLTPDNDW